MGMIGADQFERMRDGAIYVNSARAALHDLDALTKALQAGKLSEPASTISRARCSRPTIRCSR
jgi:phosphoglycerate dehydrogenase-like enzyme